MQVVPADPAQVATSAMPRLVDLASVETTLGDVGTIWRPAPGLGVILVVPAGGGSDGWAVVDPGWVSDHAEDADLWEGALSRLRHDVRHSDHVPADITDPWGRLTSIASPSPHTASWLLVPDALLEPGIDAFIAAPDQHRLLLLACTGDPIALRGPVMRAPHHVLDRWQASPDRVSPHLYHWSASQGLRQLTRFTTGEPELCLPDDVREWLGTKDENSAPSS